MITLKSFLRLRSEWHTVTLQSLFDLGDPGKNGSFEICWHRGDASVTYCITYHDGSHDGVNFIH